MSSISSNFTFLAQSAKGHSGGLTIGWNLSSVKCLNSWGALFGMVIYAHWVEANYFLNILNVYGPYNNRFGFWDNLRTSRL